MDTTQPAFVDRPPRDEAGWAALFDPATLPVLASTAAALEEWRQVEDGVDAHLLAQTLAGDPLMTLKLLTHIGRLRRDRRGRDDGEGDVETVTEALVLLGIGPFFRAFGPQPAAEDLLADRPEALQGFEAVLHRARRAAQFALGFAAHRMDHDAAVIHQAALLHDAVELMLWLRAPALAQEMARRQQADPTLRSVQVQEDVLGTRLEPLQHALMRSWRMPALLVHLNDEKHADETQVRNVILAMNIARHSTKGWDNPAMSDDLVAVQQLLQLGEMPTMRLLLDIDGEL